VFTETERALYAPAIDDKPLGRFDPLAIKRRLVIGSEGKLNEYLDIYETGSELERLAAEEKLVALTRTAFGFKPLAEADGVCDADVIDVLGDFLEFLAKKPQPHSGSPTPSPCAEPEG